MANPITGYPQRRNNTYLSLLPKSVMTDFRIGLTYYTADVKGVEDDGGGNYSERSVLRAVTVAELTIERDLMDFKNAVKSGNAYKLQASTT